MPLNLPENAVFPGEAQGGMRIFSLCRSKKYGSFTEILRPPGLDAQVDPRPAAAKIIFPKRI